MPGTGFGFPSYPQRPSLNPQDVGALLRMNAQPAEPDADDMGASPMMAPAAAPRLADNSADDTPLGGDDAVPSAIHIAARELTARGPAATQGTQREPAAPGTIQQLARMGLSPQEIQFLTIGGSVV
jgi:hypothetical protein